MNDDGQWLDDETRDAAFSAEAGTQWAESVNEPTARRFLAAVLVDGKPIRAVVDLASTAELAISQARAILGDPHADASAVMSFWNDAFPAPGGRRWAAFLERFISAAAAALSDRFADEQGDFGKLGRDPHPMNSGPKRNGKDQT